MAQKYRRLFSSSSAPRRKPGPKGPSAEPIVAIIELKRRNPRFGCVRIAQQIAHIFGIESTGPSWLTFIAQTKDSLWSVDLFRCESILLRSRWVMVVLDVLTRRLIGFGVEPAPIDGVSVCRMFNRAIPGQRLPKRASTDHDPLFRFHRWLANLRVLEIEETKTVPYAPVSHPFVERLIGTIRREHLDRVFFWNATDLVRKLDEFKHYYNAARVHRGLAGVTPAEPAGVPSPPHSRCAGSIRLAAALPGPVSDPDRRLTTNSPPTGFVHSRFGDPQCGLPRLPSRESRSVATLSLSVPAWQRSRNHGSKRVDVVGNLVKILKDEGDQRSILVKLDGNVVLAQVRLRLPKLIVPGRRPA